MTKSPGKPTAAGLTRLAGRARSAARLPVLSGRSSAGDVALAAAVATLAVVAAARGLWYVPHSIPALPPHRFYGPPAASPRPPLPGLVPSRPDLLAIPSWPMMGVLVTAAPLAFRRTYRPPRSA